MHRPVIGKLRSPLFTPAQPMFPREPTAAKDKKASVVTVLQRQREVKDWRSMLHQRKEQEQQRMAVNSEVQQLKEAKSDLVMKEMELERTNRQLAGALAAKESLEVKLEDMNLRQKSNEENIGAKEEEVRVRNSDITRLDLEVSAKEKRLEEVSNAAIEAEKKIFGFEVSVKSLEGKVVSLENENDNLRDLLSKKRADFEGKCLLNEELARKIVVEERHAHAMEEKLARTAEELKTANQRVEEAEAKGLELKLTVDSLLLEAAKFKEEKKLESERDRKTDFANARAKFDITVKPFEVQEQTSEKCPNCEVLKIKLEDSEGVVRTTKVDLEIAKEELGRIQRKEMIFKEEMEAMLDTKMNLQNQVKNMEELVTDQEVKLKGAEAVTSLKLEKLEAMEDACEVLKKELGSATLSLEEERRGRKALEAKALQYEERAEKLVIGQIEYKKEMEEALQGFIEFLNNLF